MNQPLLEQAFAAASEFDALTTKEFGGPIAAPELVVPAISEEGLQTIRGHELLPQANLVPLGTNFKRLLQMPHKGFGLLHIEGGVRRLYPAVITARTTADKLHVTYIPDHVVLPDNAEQNIDDTGEDVTLSALQKKLLSSARGIQNRDVGTEHSHGTAIKAVTEIGHTAMVLRSLTDEATMQDIQTGTHAVHTWSEEEAGIASRLTERNKHTPGSFDMDTTYGRRNISLPTIVLEPTTPNVLLVSHPAFELPEVEDPKIIFVGLGLVAARQYFGSETAVKDRMLRVMEQVH